MDSRPVFDPHRTWRDGEERDRLRDRGQLLSRNLTERASELRDSAMALSGAVEDIRLDLERLVEITERLAELDG